MSIVKAAHPEASVNSADAGWKYQTGMPVALIRKARWVPWN